MLLKMVHLPSSKRVVLLEPTFRRPAGILQMLPFLHVSSRQMFRCNFRADENQPCPSLWVTHLTVKPHYSPGQAQLAKSRLTAAGKLWCQREQPEHLFWSTATLGLILSQSTGVSGRAWLVTVSVSNTKAAKGSKMRPQPWWGQSWWQDSAVMGVQLQVLSSPGRWEGFWRRESRELGSAAGLPPPSPHDCLHRIRNGVSVRLHQR